jgi:uncharacterized protein (UPF0335 family)
MSKNMKKEISDANKKAIIASLRRRIKKLESENKQFRQELKVIYAEIYKKI